MDKYEYKIRSEEIKSLIAKGEYVDAAAIADTIDWRRVKSVMMLCTISDLYKINRRFEDARDMLLLAYDRHPGGRSIVYSLCELSIKMGEFVQAVEYYKEFVQVASKDSGRYVLQYKLYEAQDVSLEERIAVLEELKSKDYTEKWAYELAYLYHRIGLATKCVEECDELIVWFGEGKYVLKAMELKKLHEPLTADQQAKYNQMKGFSQPEETVAAERRAAAVPEEMGLAEAPTKELPGQDLDIQIKLMNVGQYDTINMQKELAENMKELWEGPAPEEIARTEEENIYAKAASEAVTEGDTVSEEAVVSEKTADADLKELSPEKQQMDSVTRAIIAPLLNSDTDIIDLPDDEGEEEPVEPEETKVEEVFFGETGELDVTATQIMEEMKKENLGEDTSKDADTDTEAAQVKQQPVPAAEDMTKQHAEEKLTKFDNMLGMEYDGQISMVMPESEQIEKQITGQIRLEDVLVEWEKMKKNSEQKRMEAVRQRVLEQTGAMFTEFEAAARDGLLEQLEKGNGSIGLQLQASDTEDSGEDLVVLENDEDTEIDNSSENDEFAETAENNEFAETAENDEFVEEEAFEEAETEELVEIDEIQEPEGAEELYEAKEFVQIEEADEFAQTDEFEETDEFDEAEELTEIEEVEAFAEINEAEESEETDEAEALEETEEFYEAEEVEGDEEPEEDEESEEDKEPGADGEQAEEEATGNNEGAVAEEEKQEKD